MWLITGLQFSVDMEGQVKCILNNLANVEDQLYVSCVLSFRLQMQSAVSLSLSLSLSISISISHSAERWNCRSCTFKLASCDGLKLSSSKMYNKSTTKHNEISASGIADIFHDFWSFVFTNQILDLLGCFFFLNPMKTKQLSNHMSKYLIHNRTRLNWEIAQLYAIFFYAIVIAAVCGFCILQKLSWWNTGSLEGKICCSKTVIYISEFIVPSKTCKLSILYARMHPHTIRDAGFWTERWWHARRSPSPSSLARRTRHPWFPTRMSHLDSSEHWTHIHFETVHFKCALAHRTLQHFWTMFTYGFLFAR